jgi:hypothetical protein
VAEKPTTRNELGPDLTPGQRLKRAAIGVLFFSILLIPRVRRLRRQVQVWTAVRVMAGLTGLGLVWFYFSGRGAGFLVCAALLILFALLIRATPVVKSLDDRARELGALSILNGGIMISSPGETPVKATIFAGTERLTVEDDRGRLFAEIPLAKIQRCAARALEPGEGKPWEFEIVWSSPNLQTTRFHFSGFFAEHLARVAEATIENLRREELTVLK